MFFERSGPVWETLRRLESRLHDAGIDYVVIGGLALNAHQYPRQTVDVDVVLTKEGYKEFRRRLAGRKSKNQSVRFPDPGTAELCGELRTVSLARLIELKLVTWRFKDWGDVVELIRRHSLPESFADQLDPVVRSAFAECFDQANDEEYDGPSDE